MAQDFSGIIRYPFFLTSSIVIVIVRPLRLNRDTIVNLVTAEARARAPKIRETLFSHVAPSSLN